MVLLKIELRDIVGSSFSEQDLRLAWSGICEFMFRSYRVTNAQKLVDHADEAEIEDKFAKFCCVQITKHKRNNWRQGDSREFSVKIDNDASRKI